MLTALIVTGSLSVVPFMLAVAIARAERIERRNRA